MKKQILFLVCLLLALCTVGAAAADVVLEDEGLRAVFSDSGALTEVTDLTTGTTLLSGTGGDAFRVTIDASAKNIWRAQTNGSATVVMTVADATTAVTAGENTVTFDHVISLKKAGDVKFQRTFTLQNGQITVSSKLENGLSKGVVIFADPVVLSGLDASLSLTWPNHEGENYVDAVQKASQGQLSLSATYPSTLSMQWVSLYNGTSSLYYGVHDPNAEYKTFTFRGVYGGAEVACTQAPYAAPGKEAVLADAVIAAVADDDWTGAADIYRTFIAEKTDWTRTPSPTAYETVGHYYWIMTYPWDDYRGAYAEGAPNGEAATMRDYVQMLRHRSGATTMAYLGWHDGGFDTDFPDYDFSEAQGGEELFRTAMEAIEQDGNVAMIYFNVHTAEVQSEWYNEMSADGQIKGYAAATLNDQGEMIEEIYWPGYGLKYYAMCPMAQDFQDAICEGVERVLQQGADAAFLDQLMEMPVYLCYNPMHGHTSPATAYYEGYSKMLQRIHDLFNQYGVDPYFSCEGICDAYIKYIDVCGLQGERHLNSYDEHYPVLARYALPTKLLGIDSGSEYGKLMFGRAWLMGSPFMVNETWNETVPVYTAVYKQYFDVYTNGVYQHTEGLSGIPEGLMCSVLESKEQTRAAVQYMNPTLKPIEARIIFDVPGTLVSVVDAMTGEAVQLNNGELVFTAEKWGSGSYLFTWTE